MPSWEFIWNVALGYTLIFVWDVIKVVALATAMVWAMWAVFWLVGW